MFSKLGLSAVIVVSSFVSSATAKPFTPNTVAASTSQRNWTDNVQACAGGLNGLLPSSVPTGFNFSGNVRRYYVAAEEVEWDYAPTGWDNWLGLPLDASPRAISAGVNTYGTKWIKALYRGYTDASFSTLSEQPPWQGTQGPTLRAELGDMIEILFVNKLSKNYATMHSMGLAYSKTSEGGDYAAATMAGQNLTLPEGDAVPPVERGLAPGGCVVYKWLANENAAPNPGEPAKTHSYHSYISMDQDTNAGLIGPTIIYAPGQMNETMSANREFAILYMVYEESLSFLSDVNSALLTNSSSNSSVVDPLAWVAKFGTGNSSIWIPQLTNLVTSSSFASATQFFTINGYIFSNLPNFEMCQDDNVIWYLNGYGSASHVFHLHGNGFTYNGINKFAESINDGVGKTLLTDASGTGKWQVVCHVNDHLEKGMVGDYQVYPKGQCPLEPLSSN